jgi:hypothetical protein
MPLRAALVVVVYAAADATAARVSERRRVLQPARDVVREADLPQTDERLQAQGRLGRPHHPLRLRSHTSASVVCGRCRRVTFPTFCDEVPGTYASSSARLGSGGPARTVGLYSTSCSRPSNVRLPIMSRETSG